MNEPDEQVPHPNAAILADLAAKAAKQNLLNARVVGEPIPGPDAEGERIKPIAATQEDPA